MFVGVAPYDYNLLVVKSLAGSRCHAGQVCGLGSNIHTHRLRYAIGKFFGVPSTNITGFALENTNKFVEPYWPSVSINGQRITRQEGDSKEIEAHAVNQPTSNNASNDNHQTIPRIATETDQPERIRKHVVFFLCEQLELVLIATAIRHYLVGIRKRV